jgi:deazaflavin-dependent oxidoreductase (nitroreductase family)
MSQQQPEIYNRPDKLTPGLNNFVATLAKLGISLKNTRVLYVRGRKSGQLRSTPVDFFRFSQDGQRYLVAPRGTTQWVRNLRAAGEGSVRLGWKVTRFTAVELDDAEKPAILREYLKRWKSESDRFFDGVGPNSAESEIERIAPKHPIFRLTIN